MTTHQRQHMLILYICFMISSLVMVPEVWATPWTPLEWQEKGKFRHWSGDRDRNFIDDRIDTLVSSRPRNEKIDITVDFNQCVTGTGSDKMLKFLREKGDVVYVGTVVTFAVVSNVELKEIADIAARSEVAMVEQYMAPRPNLDFASRALKVLGGATGPLPFTYSPNTVADAFPSLSGSGINIAVIDTGIDQTHQTFSGAYIAGFNCTDPSNPGMCVAGDPDDETGHGTHVAGIALGRGDSAGNNSGMATGAKLIDLKVYSGPADFSPPSAIEAAMEWVILNRNRDWGPGHTPGIQVVNMSLSGCDHSDGLSLMDQLVNAMVANGIVVTSSAGNRNPSDCGDASTGIINRIGSVAAAGLAITTANSVVGSISIDSSGFSFAPTVDRSDDEIFFDSLRGPRADGADKPDLAAPGTAVSSAEHNTISNYVLKVGTSMASPAVAGVASLILQEEPDINPGSLKDLLIRTAHRPVDLLPNVQNPTWDANWGHGLMDAHQAIVQIKGQGNEQRDLTFEGFGGESHPQDPVWMSPAIEFNSGGDQDVLLLGLPNDINVRVRNRGTDASNVEVVIGMYYFSASDTDQPQFYEIATLRESFPHGITDINYTWTPAADLDIFSGPEPHVCIRVSLNYGLDSDYRNHSNVAQRNLRRVATSSPAVCSFRVENPLPREAVIHLDIRPGDKNPPGWMAKLNLLEVALTPSDCAKTVSMTMTPPAGAIPGEEALFHVYATAITDKDQRVPIGGLSCQAYVPLEKIQPDRLLWVLLIIGGLVLSTVAFYFIYFRRTDRDPTEHK